MKKQILKNIFSNYFATAIGVGMGLFLVPFLIRKMGSEAFGVTILAESAIAFFEIATVSVRIALSRYAALALAKDEKKEFAEYLSTGRVILCFSGAVVFLSGLLLSFYFPAIFRVPAPLVTESRMLFFLLTIAFSLSIPNIVYWSVLYARQRFDLINVSLTAGYILRAASVVVFYSFIAPGSSSLVAYGFIYLAMILIQNTLIYFWHIGLMPDVRIAFSLFRSEKVKEILAFGFHTSVSRASSLFSINAQVILINLFWGPAANTMYSVGVKFPSVMSRLFMDATWTLTPTFTQLAAQNDKGRLKRLFFVYTKLITILVVPLGLLLILMSGPIIHIWVGAGFAQAANVLFILTVPLVTSIPFSVTGCVLNAYGRVKWPSRVSLASAFISILVGVVLGKYFSLGLPGMAAASAGGSFLFYTFYLPYYACRVSGISFAEYWTQAFLKPFAWSALVAGGGLLAFQAKGYDIYLPRFFISMVLLVPSLSYLGAYFIVLDASEKKKVCEIIFFKKNRNAASEVAWIQK